MFSFAAGVGRGGGNQRAELRTRLTAYGLPCSSRFVERVRGASYARHPRTTPREFRFKHCVVPATRLVAIGPVVARAEEQADAAHADLRHHAAKAPGVRRIHLVFGHALGERDHGRNGLVVQEVLQELDKGVVRVAGGRRRAEDTAEIVQDGGRWPGQTQRCLRVQCGLERRANAWRAVAWAAGSDDMELGVCGGGGRIVSS